MRYRYILQLPVELVPVSDPPSGLFRHAELEDREALALLMHDAYVGTIDDDGETIDDARNEVRSIYEGTYGEALLDTSWVYVDAGQLLAACLITFWEGAPLVASLMTAAQIKGRGLAGQLLRAALTNLSQRGYQEVHAFVTQGNTPSERALARAGFQRIEIRN